MGHISQIPQEILIMVLDFGDLKRGDLYILCLVSKQFYHAAVARLYEKFDNDWTDQSLTRSLLLLRTLTEQPSHADHIKTINMGSHGFGCHCEIEPVQHYLSKVELDIFSRALSVLTTMKTIPYTLQLRLNCVHQRRPSQVERRALTTALILSFTTSVENLVLRSITNSAAWFFSQHFDLKGLLHLRSCWLERCWCEDCPDNRRSKPSHAFHHKVAQLLGCEQLEKVRLSNIGPDKELIASFQRRFNDVWYVYSIDRYHWNSQLKKRDSGPKHLMDQSLVLSHW